MGIYLNPWNDGFREALLEDTTRTMCPSRTVA